MPVITVDIGQMPGEQKPLLIKQLSCSAAEITGIPLSAFTVVIHELPGENIGIGAKTVAEMKAEARGG